MNKHDIVLNLRALRLVAEQEAETKIQEIECTLLTALNDVCDALCLDYTEKQLVLGDAIELLGESVHGVSKRRAEYTFETQLRGSHDPGKTRTYLRQSVPDQNAIPESR